MMQRRAFIGGMVAMAAAPLPHSLRAAAAPAFSPYVAISGESSAPVAVFVHGGPGSNSAMFEFTTAETLAKRGWRVLSYDQRGCGRSGAAPEGTTFNFAEAVADLEAIRVSARAEQMCLIGHSFGGVVALQYAMAHPAKAQRVVLVAAPLDYPAALRTIRANARLRYGDDNPQGIAYLNQIDRMDPASAEYAGFTFQHAIAAGLYQASSLSSEAEDLYRSFLSGPHRVWATHSAPAPFIGFLRSEAYTTRSFFDLAASVAQSTSVTAIYGEQDGLFDEDQLERISDAIGEPKVSVLKDASHFLFVDRQDAFLDLLI